MQRWKVDMTWTQDKQRRDGQIIIEITQKLWKARFEIIWTCDEDEVLRVSRMKMEVDIGKTDKCRRLR